MLSLWRGFFKRQKFHVAADAVVFVLLMVTFLLLLLKAEPVQRDFDPNDITLSHEYIEESVSSNILLVTTGAIPLVLVVILSVAFKKKAEWDTYFAFCSFVVNYLVTEVITETAKITTGGLRPDFLTRCEWDPVDEVCTGDPAIIQEGRKSFFSGHSSLSFSGLGFLALYLAGRIKLFDGQGPLWKLFVFLSPFVGAAVISMTRLSENKHHLRDVLIGSIVGTVVAILVYRIYYAPLISKDCGKPKLQPAASSTFQSKKEDIEATPVVSNNSDDRKGEE